MADRSLYRTALGTLAAAMLATFASADAHAAPEPAPDVAEEPAAGTVGVVVVRENGSGSAARAQTYVDALVANIAQVNGWPGATGKYFTKRSKAERHFEQVKPAFGFISFNTYLALRAAHGIQPLAVADAGSSGGAQYFVVSKTHVTIDGCKGKTLATNHAGDGRYVDAVVSGDAFDLADFDVVPMRRPVQTLKAVINDEAECALVDDTQLVAATTVDGGAALRPVWSSSPLPAILVVAFGSATAEHVDGFRKNLAAICEGDGRPVCDAAGLQSPRAVEADAFAAQQAAYDG